MDVEKFRKKVQMRREKEWIREAVRARKFSNQKTFQQGLALIKFGLEINEAGKHAKHR